MLLYNILFIVMYSSFGSRGYFFAGGELKQSFMDSFSLLRLRKLKGGFPLSRDFYIRTHRN